MHDKIILLAHEKGIAVMDLKYVYMGKKTYHNYRRDTPIHLQDLPNLDGDTVMGTELILVDKEEHLDVS